MASTLRYKPVALLAVEFYNKNGNFTEETTTGYHFVSHPEKII